MMSADGTQGGGSAHRREVRFPFILRIPPSVLARVFYAWVPLVAFLAWPPVVSGLLAILLLLGLVLLKAQRSTWERLIRQGRLGTGAVRYEDRPWPPARYLLLNLVVVLVIGVGLGYLLDGRADLSGLQWFLMTAGFFLLEQSFTLYWAPVRYFVTGQGVWVLYDADTLFIRFEDVAEARIERDYVVPFGWGYILAPIRYPAGLRLLPANRAGFKWRVREVVLTPTDLEEFVQAFPLEFSLVARRYT
jgi:hypothetical protein